MSKYVNLKMVENARKNKIKLKIGSLQCPGGVENQMIVMTLQHFKLKLKFPCVTVKLVENVKIS